MSRLSAAGLARLTLARQFPRVDGQFSGIERRDSQALSELIGRIGPIQSQVPRAPFVGIAARLPGID